MAGHRGRRLAWQGHRRQAIGSLLGWQAAGLSIHMAGDHERAGRHVARILYTIASVATASYERSLASVAVAECYRPKPVHVGTGIYAVLSAVGYLYQ